MWHSYDDRLWGIDDEVAARRGGQSDQPSPETLLPAPTRTVISVVLTSEVETNPDVIACTVAAIEALPNVADVTTRKVRLRVRGPQPDGTR